ncbi:MAG: hypothetical protein KAT68_17235 [Bacteroidales bacterium]|nr:hypothetical protein [Bacteroidales bacterium]
MAIAIIAQDFEIQRYDGITHTGTDLFIIKSILGKPILFASFTKRFMNEKIYETTSYVLIQLPYKNNKAKSVNKNLFKKMSLFRRI